MVIITLRLRDVAQLGSALPWGGRGRQFKSDRSDQTLKMLQLLFEAFYLTMIYSKIVLLPINNDVIE